MLNESYILYISFEIFESDSSLVVRMDASQAFDPGSSPGYRKYFFLNIRIK